MPAARLATAPQDNLPTLSELFFTLVIARNATNLRFIAEFPVAWTIGPPRVTGPAFSSCYMPARRNNNNRPGGARRPAGPPRPFANSGGYRRPPPKEVDPESEIEVDGTIVQVLAGTMFKVELAINKQVVLAHISGKMRKRFIRLVVGDRVKMEMSPYDTTKARITYRM